LLIDGATLASVIGNKLSLFLQCKMSLPVQVFGRRDDGAIHALMRPATEKRQGTKSRWVMQRRFREHYGDLVAAAGLMSLD
jgi:hypothetical protein